MRTYKIVLNVETERERELIEAYIRHSLKMIKIKNFSMIEEEDKHDIS